MASQLRQLTATATVVSGSAALKSVVLTSTGGVGVCDIRDGGASGTVRLTVRCGADTTVSWTAADPEGSQMRDMHATLAFGAGSGAASFETD